MGNKASSPSRNSESGGRIGSTTSPRSRGERQRNGQGERITSTSGINARVETEDVFSSSRQDAEGDTRSAPNRPQRQQQQQQQQPQQQQEMSWYQMAKAGYQELVNAIIRPPRAQYEVDALGPMEFEFVGKAFKRIDFRLLNDRGHVLECSHWQPNGWRRAERLPCIVYMHGNSSARVEALPQLSLALSLGTTLVAFDFAGSGKSGGEHVSLGYYERDDLKAVIEHLRKSGQVSAIALWGRSMGAATALLHGDRDPSIAALVLDSAFADLTQLAEEMVERGREAGLTVPGIVVKMVMRMIRGTVAKTANFNVRDLCPIKHADRTFIPALFVAAVSDDFIKPHHSKQICEAYAGDKNYITVNGDHNSPRPGFLFDSVYIFLQNYLQVPLEWGLDRQNTVMGFPPWHYASGGGRGAAAATAMYGAVTGGGGGGGGGGSDLDPDFADFDWDGIGVDDVGVDGIPSVGMTRARQAEFQTALFHMLAQERSDQSPQEADQGGGGHRGQSAAAPSPSSGRTDPRNHPPSSTSAGVRPNNVRENGDASRGLFSRDTTGDAVGFREYEALTGGKPGPREKNQLLIEEEEEQGAEAVAAVAAALKAAGATPVAATRAPAGFATPSAASRPMMAPFSVSDTSDFEDTMSPVDSYLRQTGAGPATAAETVAEEEDDEGGVEGVDAAMDARHHGVAAAAAREDFSSPLSAEAGEDEESFFDARDSSAVVNEEGDAARRRGSSNEGKTPAENYGVAVGGRTTRDDDERDSLSGGDEDEDGGWQQAVGFVASPVNGARGREGSSGVGSGRGTTGGSLVAEAEKGWSCLKCTLRNDARAQFCLACTSPRAVG